MAACATRTPRDPLEPDPEKLHPDLSTVTRAADGGGRTDPREGGGDRSPGIRVTRRVQRVFRANDHPPVAPAGTGWVVKRGG
ncbi:hypothetical protein Psuf_002390 [Phytohabitans suffuscus]|uniref:Uncharacterized protein n=1 Tax=Phytohabitans suffuscus TaxID=624315 RepID=A0A6F8Y9Z5_9ACTN|nr:hypothetical protein Psuf_002390 [Phytohabitans suffuscus]